MVPLAAMLQLPKAIEAKARNGLESLEARNTTTKPVKLPGAVIF